MRTINAIIVVTALAAILVAPVAGAATNAVSDAPAAATDVSADNQTCAMEACCQATASPGHYATLQTGSLAEATDIGRTRHAVKFFSGDAAISIGRNGGNAGWPDDTAFNRFPSGDGWAGRDAGPIRQPRGLRLLSWNW